MVENEDVYTRSYIKEGWASLGFGIHDSFDAKVEDISDFSIYNYTKDIGLNKTFYGRGGFVQSLDILLTN